MPWRLILLIIILAVFLAFITFNMDNRCDVSFGIKVYKDIPVFLTIFTSFILGMLCALPIKLRSGKKRDETTKDKKPAKDDFSGSGGVSYNTNTGTDEKIKQDAASAKERFFAKRFGKKQ
jgi:uncharacterized integral membrane protein